MGGHGDGFDVAVIGGGASGLAAAIAAVRAGSRVAVIERDVAAGLSILTTGNGRCNLSNGRLDVDRYLDPTWAHHVLGEGPEDLIRSFFEELGLVICEIEGRWYPVTRRAASVRDVLLAEVERLGVTLLCGADLAAARLSDDRWELELEEPARPIHFDGDTRRARRALAAAPRRTRIVAARSVVLAAGGSSERVCALFDIPHVPETPVLCPIACEVPGLPSGSLSRVDGLRVDGALTLERDGEKPFREEGEVLFRSYGISGIVSFDISRRARAGDLLEVDLLPIISPEELREHLSRREGLRGPYAAADATWFDGLLARPLAGLINELAGGSLEATARFCHAFPLTVAGLTETGQAQVRRGGIPLEAVEPGTLAVARSVTFGAPTAPCDTSSGTPTVSRDTSPSASAASHGASSDTSVAPGRAASPCGTSVALSKAESPCGAPSGTLAASCNAPSGTPITSEPSELIRNASYIAPTGSKMPAPSRNIPSIETTAPYGEHDEGPGLFACGEALNMDADCGGYNLAWAWLTGLCAGFSAARAAGNTAIV